MVKAADNLAVLPYYRAADVSAPVAVSLGKRSFVKSSFFSAVLPMFSSGCSPLMQKLLLLMPLLPLQSYRALESAFFCSVLYCSTINRMGLRYTLRG